MDVQMSEGRGGANPGGAGAPSPRRARPPRPANLRARREDSLSRLAEREHGLGVTPDMVDRTSGFTMNPFYIGFTTPRIRSPAPPPPPPAVPSAHAGRRAGARLNMPAGGADCGLTYTIAY